MNKGKINGPVDGNVNRSYATCAKCQVRRKKIAMHAVLARGSRAVVAYLCTRCVPTGANN